MKEFELIKHFFTKQIVKRKDVELGIGDDCAVLSPIENQNIVVTTDTLVAGVHFPLNTSPKAIGHKAVAVNLSDIAAMGAKPSWISILHVFYSVFLLIRIGFRVVFLSISELH